MDPHLRTELERLLSPGEIDALLRRIGRRGVAAASAGPATRHEPGDGDIVLNRGHYFEVLDRVHVASSHLEEHVGKHPVVRRHTELGAIYDRAAEALAELYQAVGRLYPLDEPW